MQMSIAVNVALILAAAAIIPSAGSFTPAIFVSALAAVVGATAIALGQVRRGLLTIYLALSAAVVSPVLLDVPRTDVWLVTLPAMGVLLGLLLYLDYNRRKSSADRE